MTDPIEQAWSDYNRTVTQGSEKAVAALGSADALPEIVAFGALVDAKQEAVTQAILRYHPDVVRLVLALRRVKFTLTSEGVRAQAFDITDDVAVIGMYESVDAALVPFTEVQDAL